MKKFSIKIYGDVNRDVKIGLQHDCLWLLEGDKSSIIGSNVKETRKGFYYDDLFFARQFVPWSRLVPLD